MPVPESVATEIRNRAREAIDQARREASKPQGSLNETIDVIESARAKPSRPHARGATTTYYHTCFYCGGFVKRSFSPEKRETFLGQAVDLHECGHYPYEGLHPDSASVNVITDIEPYYDISCGPNTRGVAYRPGYGGLITSRAHLREVARLNGKLCR